jgi:alpha-L-fucosidase 2
VRLPENLTSPAQRKFFTHMKSAAPVIPIEDAQLDGKPVRRIAVAQKYNPQRSNVENPELFPIWPFRIFGLERPMLEEARNAYLCAAATTTSAGVTTAMPPLC